MNACRCGCRREAAPHRLGFTRSCYQRWLNAGKPEVLPPPRWTWAGGSREGRIEDYAELLSWGLSPAAAALRLGVCRKTIARYEAALRETSAA